MNYEHCAALVREADRDRYLATLFTPAQHRNALFALYAFNVEIARVRDLAREPMPGEIRLQWWREVLSGLRADEAAAHPVAAALLATLAKHNFVATPLLELIDAHTFDLYDAPMATMDDLELYAIQTQSPLFAAAAGILSEGRMSPELFTLDAGIACAIAGALHGFARHAARRQLYVPLDVLNRHRVNREDIFAGQASEQLSAALGEMRSVARESIWRLRMRNLTLRRRKFFRRSCRSPWWARFCAGWTAPPISHFRLRRSQRGGDNGGCGARRTVRAGFFDVKSYSAAAATASPAIQRSRSISARSLSAPLRARFLAEPRPNLRPSLSNAMVSDSGGNRPKFTFIG